MILITLAYSWVDVVRGQTALCYESRPKYCKKKRAQCGWTGVATISQGLVRYDMD